MAKQLRHSTGFGFAVFVVGYGVWNYINGAFTAKFQHTRMNLSKVTNTLVSRATVTAANSSIEVLNAKPV